MSTEDDGERSIIRDASREILIASISTLLKNILMQMALQRMSVVSLRYDALRCRIIDLRHDSRLDPITPCRNTIGDNVVRHGDVTRTFT